MSGVETPCDNFFRPPLDAGEGGSVTRVEQISLLNVRISTTYPANPVGQDIALQCIGEDGHFYFGKTDRDGRPIRATEWIATKLAEHLGISVADCAVLESDAGETLFGSRCPTSVADQMELDHFINTAAKNELGQPASWLGQYFARVSAFDLFVDNPDRNLRNFVLERDGTARRLRAIDFASARLIDFSTDRFPFDFDNTIRIGKFIRARHGSHQSSAIEMLERIGAVPPEVVRGILTNMPEEWLSNDQMEAFIEVWSDGRRNQRLSHLRALIERGW